jgi:hypothetical protein
LPVSLPDTDKHSLLAAFLHFHRNSAADDFVCHCALAISTTTGRSAATCAAGSGSGPIQPPSMHIGIHQLIADRRIPFVQDGDEPFWLDIRDLDSFIERNKRVV